MNESLISIFMKWSGESPDKITPLPKSGSNRKYYRLSSKNHSAIGVENTDYKENIAFVEFTKHFLKTGLNVPKIYIEDLDNNVYLLEDLGNTTLFSHIKETKKQSEFPTELIKIYKKVISALPVFQITASEGFPFGYCYPRSEFDKQSMMWDLNYFKYYFLKLANIEFDEQALENDFQTFTDYLLSTERKYFLYRDFQSRNIMLKDDEVYFIDYQGGRKGALQYDIASLLYDAKAEIPDDVRIELLEHYITELSKHIYIDKEKFKAHFFGYVLIRIMQAMGAYGFRGFYEKKAHFLASIPPAIENMKGILKNINLLVELPTMMSALKKLVASEKLQKISTQRAKLTVSVNSFSYKRGIPIDESGHGGGFVFDCRALNNPGRYEQYKKLTGKDLKVIEFLQKEENVSKFAANVENILDISIKNYLERSFGNLMISFGCTGGQHRSVYMAELFAEKIKNKYNVNVNLRHREQEMVKNFD